LLLDLHAVHRCKAAAVFAYHRGVPRIPPYRPQLAQLVKTPPEGAEWIHELKYDGYRIGCRIDGKRIELISRNGKDWTHAYPAVVKAAGDLKVQSALLDGEVCMVLPDGRTSFQALQNAGSEPQATLVYFVFDILYLNGRSLLGQPLHRRKAALHEVVRGSRIQYAEHIEGSGADAFREACRLGAEGIVSKRHDQPYMSGKRTGWVKTKCVQRQEFVIGGFTDPEGSRQGIGALLVGYYDLRNGETTWGPALPRSRHSTCADGSKPSKSNVLRSHRRRPDGLAATRTGSSRSWSARSCSPSGRAKEKSDIRRSRGCAATNRHAPSAANARRRPPHHRRAAERFLHRPENVSPPRVPSRAYWV